MNFLSRCRLTLAPALCGLAACGGGAFENSSIRTISLDEVTRGVNTRIMDLREVLQSQPIMKEIRLRTEENQKLSEQQIAEQDQRWRNGQAASSVQGRKDSDCSQKLREFQTAHSEVVEIFVTDRIGLNACLTDTTSDYYQADERWWIDTFHRNQSLYSDVEYDSSAGSEAISIYIPIADAINPNHVLGVAKAVLDIQKFALKVAESRR